MTFEVRQGEAASLLRELGPASIDAVVTDPPYHLTENSRKWSRRVNVQESPYGRHKVGDRGFMGANWDGGDIAHDPAFWAEVLRVCKPGAHVVAFGGSRTYHRLTCAIEDAGFEIRDCLSWLYGGGFPKSLDVSKAVDKRLGAVRNVTRPAARPLRPGESISFDQRASSERERRDDPVSAAAASQGLGTALKPAWEPIVLAREPLVGTVAQNVLECGTGALAIAHCRIETAESWEGGGPTKPREGGIGYASSSSHPLGRWPANVVLDQDAAEQLDEQSGERPAGAAGVRRAENNVYSPLGTSDTPWGTYGDFGGASRFFYTAKAGSGERHYAGKNTHPTVKPVDLMRWLCRLVTPKGGLILDPFTGSGSTGVAALAEGFRFLGFEREAEYVEIARRRIAGPLFAQEAVP